jgi:uncharacterized Zn-binding protein involved in type VI secretion
VGSPAARLGDPTVHGGTIVVGLPTVLIGGQPASRIGDMHVCPQVTGVVPHVGGPLVLGSFTVLTGGVPQSRVGDMLICIGPPDAVAMGCPTVLVGMSGGGVGFGAILGGLFAGLTNFSEGGVSALLMQSSGGPETGGGHAPNAIRADMAKTSRVPTPTERREIREAIRSKASQVAIDKTIKYYGIDTSNCSGKIVYDASLRQADAETSPKRQIRIGPSAFSGHSAGFLGTTIMHEVSHTNQVAKHGWPQSGQDVAAYESMGYETGESNAQRFRITKSERLFYETSKNRNYDALSSENQGRYSGGRYWGMN